MNTSPSYNIKCIADSNNENSIYHPAIRVGANAMVVIIDESIVQKLHINEECWFEQIPTSDGIILRISSKKVVSSDIVEASRV
ncbi:MAG: hypothetical protein WAM14_04735 [Candidatus Nitrosopolaris sp.]